MSVEYSGPSNWAAEVRVVRLRDCRKINASTASGDDRKAEGMVTDEETASPLATDVAISRVILAAVKSKNGAELSQADRNAARQVREVLLRRREAATLTSSIPTSLIADDRVRGTLERSLSEIPSTTPVAAVSGERIERLLRTLAELQEGHRIADTQADELLDYFDRDAAYSEQTVFRPALIVGA